MKHVSSTASSAGRVRRLGLYLFHNHAALKARGTGPYFYLPKLENHLEARLWADVLRHSEDKLRIAPQSIKVTVLIETISQRSRWTRSSTN